MTRTESGFLLPTGRSEEQDLIAEVLTRLNEDLPLTEAADPRQVWDRLVEVGAHAVLLDRDTDYGIGLLATIAQTLGTGLNADPFIWGAVAVPSLLRSTGASAAADDVAGRLASGALPTVAMHGSSGALADIGRAVTLRSAAGTDVVGGRARFVPYPDAADTVLVVASDRDGPVLTEVVEPRAVAWDHLEPFDPRTPLADALLDDAPVRVLGRLTEPFPTTLRLALFCQAAAITGSARRALADAVDYSRVREQFGMPIARFQAIRHRLADTLVEVELMRTALWHAADTGDERAMLMAAYHCMVAATAVVRANIQVHGGIGYTWEHTAHLHYRYAFAARQAICSLDSLERHLMDGILREAESDGDE